MGKKGGEKKTDGELLDTQASKDLGVDFPLETLAGKKVDLT